MVQLNILSGKQAGGSWAARRFPVRVGRSGSCDLKSEEAGVWDEHVEIGLDAGERFVLAAHSSALVIVNGHAAPRAVLRNGDIIEIGSLKLQFWLAEAQQCRLRLYEAIVWGAFGIVCLVQIALILWLPR